MFRTARGTVNPQYWTFFVKTAANGAAVTGLTYSNFANTLFVSIDDGTPAILANITNTGLTEINSTNAPGFYQVKLAATETKGFKLHFYGKGGGAGTIIVGGNNQQGGEVCYTTQEVLHKPAYDGH